MEQAHNQEPFAAAPFIKEIGRGKKGARGISREDARKLYAAMLDAAEQSFEMLPCPTGDYAPVVIPSYNGSRQMPNLTPLLAMLLAQRGVPVLIHGVTEDPGRVTTAEILRELGFVFARSIDEAMQGFARREPVFMPIELLAPKMARLLSLRRILGVRNSTHTLVKIMQPFAGPALRLTSYTHPEYLELLSGYFGIAVPVERGDAFLMRGTEGETVANAKRAQQISWFHDHRCTVLVQKQEAVDELPPLPHQRDAATTAEWIKEALAGGQPVPVPIQEQVEHCLHVAGLVHAKQVSHGEAR